MQMELITMSFSSMSDKRQAQRQQLGPCRDQGSDSRSTAQLGWE